jgi:hypothetical protein
MLTVTSGRIQFHFEHPAVRHGSWTRGVGLESDELEFRECNGREQSESDRDGDQHGWSERDDFTRWNQRTRIQSERDHGSGDAGCGAEYDVQCDLHTDGGRKRSGQSDDCLQCVESDVGDWIIRDGSTCCEAGLESGELELWECDGREQSESDRDVDECGWDERDDFRGGH